MDIIEIKLKLLEKLKLNVNEYLTIIKIKWIIDDKQFPFVVREIDITSLIEKGYLEDIIGELKLTLKADKLFFDEIINFEELYLIYPYITPNGRVLRSKYKEILGKLTRDYEENSKKYLKKVNSINDHNKIVLATKAMVTDHKNRSALDYLPKLDTYINQNGWEKYIDRVVIEHKQNIERL